MDGKKYRYEKGDWAKYIQPITNKLCQEYGLSIIDVEDGSKEKKHENYKDWSEDVYKRQMQIRFFILESVHLHLLLVSE